MSNSTNWKEQREKAYEKSERKKDGRKDGANYSPGPCYLPSFRV